VRAAWILIPLLGWGAACSNPDDRITLHVFATSSLTAAFEEMSEAFEASNPDVDVVLNVAASSTLASQIRDGAPVDVFASADQANVDKVIDRVIGEPSVFATNRLQIITEASNPLGIETLNDLADPSVLFVTCDVDVPIGAYTAAVLAKAGVTLSPVSLEENVKGIVAKVTTGEADAGIVFVTDVLAAGSTATGVDIPDDLNVIASYPIARLSNDDEAEAFVRFVTSSDGRAILEQFGFGEA
jgi:molybdate transport system substrate-binding protein